MVRVFVKGAEQVLMKLIRIGWNRIFQKRICLLLGQRIGFHAAVRSDWTKAGSLDSGNDSLVNFLCQVTYNNITRVLGLISGP